MMEEKGYDISSYNGGNCKINLLFADLYAKSNCQVEYSLITVPLLDTEGKEATIVMQEVHVGVLNPETRGIFELFLPPGKMEIVQNPVDALKCNIMSVKDLCRRAGNVPVVNKILTLESSEHKTAFSAFAITASSISTIKNMLSNSEIAPSLIEQIKNHSQKVQNNTGTYCTKIERSTLL